MAMCAAMLGGLQSQLRWHSETTETRLSPQPLRSCVLDRRFALYCATWWPLSDRCQMAAQHMLC